MNKKVYIAMSADILHNGHIKIIEEGRKYGDVIIGLLSDEAIATYKRLPMLDYATRESVISNIKGVTQVVKQVSLSYSENLKSIKPDYVVHGDDWRTGIQAAIRSEVIDILNSYGGKLIEIPYTYSVSSSDIEHKSRYLLNSPDMRRSRLKKMLNLKPYVRVIEASNGLSGLIVENANYHDPETQIDIEYDGMWVSSLCDSTFKGKPDIELVDLTSRINTINEIMEVTTKPIILDGDTGGKVEHFVYNIRTIERLGVSAIIIEDKTGLKRNSLFGSNVTQILEEPHTFAQKIRAGKRAQRTADFMIFARLESLIAGAGVEDALMRARIYLEEGGADGIMIHSRMKSGEEIVEFMKRFRSEYPLIPVIFVPTTYNHFTEEELSEIGGNIIIYANHLLRSAYPAMMNTAVTILKNRRSLEVDESCLSIKDVISLIPVDD